MQFWKNEEKFNFKYRLALLHFFGVMPMLFVYISEAPNFRGFFID